MKRLNALIIATAIGIAAPLSLHAEEIDFDLDVVDVEDTEGDVAHRLSLPESASQQAVESAQFGLDTANEARERGREFGQERAQEARERAQDARERGQATGASARGAAQDARQMGDDARSAAGGNRGPQ